MSYMNAKSNKAETIEHFMCKMMVYKKLLEHNHKVAIEVYMPGNGVMDVFDYTTGVIYEIEPRLNKTKLQTKWNQFKNCNGVDDIVMIPYKKILKDVGVDTKTFSVSLLREWREEVEKYIVT